LYYYLAFNWEVLDNNLLNLYPKARENYKFLLNGHKLFANISQRGMSIGSEELTELEGYFDSNLSDIWGQIKEIPEFQQYNEFLKEKGKVEYTGDKELSELKATIKSNKNIIKRTKVKLKRKLEF
jgi:hypothetical protein